MLFFSQNKIVMFRYFGCNLRYLNSEEIARLCPIVRNSLRCIYWSPFSSYSGLVVSFSYDIKGLLWKAIIPIDDMYLLCSVVVPMNNKDGLRYVWFLSTRDNFEFKGAFAENVNIECNSSPEMAKLLVSGKFKELM